LRNRTLVTFPSWHAQVSRIRPAGDSRTSSVIGSTMGSKPVSSTTVATQIVLLPDMTGYSVDSITM
jgi:hypothetical protein